MANIFLALLHTFGIIFDCEDSTKSTNVQRGVLPCIRGELKDTKAVMELFSSIDEELLRNHQDTQLK